MFLRLSSFSPKTTVFPPKNAFPKTVSRHPRVHVRFEKALTLAACIGCREPALAPIRHDLSPMHAIPNQVSMISTPENESEP